MQKKRYYIEVVVVLIAVITIMVIQCFNKIQRNLNAEIENNLDEISTFSKSFLESEIQERFQLLNGISKELKNRKLDDGVYEMMQSITSSYSYKRMGYITKKGVVKTTDGYCQDLSYRDFFKEGMKGKSGISPTVEDTIGTSQNARINVFSVPVYNKNDKVKGVLFATYYTERFSNRMFSKMFRGQAYSCLVSVDGKILVTSKPKETDSYESIYEYISESGTTNKKICSNIKKQIQNGGEGKGVLNQCGKDYYYCYKPLTVDKYQHQWYMFTFLSYDILDQRMAPVMKQINILLELILFLLLVCAVFYIYFSRKHKKELVKLAYVDPVTQGDNFAAFKRKAQEMQTQDGYIIAVDICEFKLINSVCGSEKGDYILKEVWKIIVSDCTKGEELAARVNSDHFIMFLVSKDRENLIRRLDSLITDMESLSSKHNIPQLFPVMGIYPTGDLSKVDEYYGNATRAKHIVKERRDRHYAFYEELDYDKFLEDRILESKFKSALKNHNFEIWYQPKFEIQSNTIVGAEALVRWRDDDGKLISPGRFIPLFEKNGSIIKLDEYVFREVCAQQKKWKDENGTLIPISVNISRVSLYYSNVAEKYGEIIKSYQLEPQWVPVEITESATIENTQITNLVEAFHTEGFKVLLDDFGSGYSSLSTLNEMHFDTLKLDKSLVDYIGNNNGEQLLEFVTNFGHNMGMEITAEGVETKEQLLFLKKLKCNNIQGFYFSKPLILSEFEERIK